jgi:AraC-like DNA-binding protein
MSREVEDLNRRLLRARDAMDRAYAEPLDIRAVAAVAYVSEAHFIRTFRAVFGETPHRYLQRRRVERSMFWLRETDRSVTDISLDVGFNSLGTFSRTFREIVARRLRNTGFGMGRCSRPTATRWRPCGRCRRCKAMKSSSFGEATAAAAP